VNTIKNLEILGVVCEVAMQYHAGDMFARLDSICGFVHPKVGILVSSKHVVGFQAWVNSVLSPHATNG
jgi:hypothetical protein